MGKPRVLTPDEHREVADLYAWGMEMWMLCAFYGIHKRTVTEYVKRSGLPRRVTGHPRHLDLDAKSNRRRSRADALKNEPDPFEDAYQLVRASARASSGKHIEPHPEGENTRSYRVTAFSLPS